MPIGTSIRIGLDASAVKAGFAKLGGQFATAGKKLGGAFKAGFTAVAAAGAAALGAGILGIKDMADYAGELVDQSTQTGVSIEKLVVLREALRLAGAEFSDTGGMINRFNKALYDATTEAGPANEALRKLGFLPGLFKNMGVEEAFQTVGMAIANFSGRSGELEDIMQTLFGARRGYKMIGFFKEYTANMELARKNVGMLAKDMEQNAQAVDDWADMMGNIKNTLRSFWLNVWKAGHAVLATSPLVDLVKGWFTSENLQTWFKKFGDFSLAIVDAIEAEGGILSYLKKQFSELAKHFAQALTDAIKGQLNPMNFLRGLGDLNKKNGDAIKQGMQKRGWETSSVLRGSGQTRNPVAALEQRLDRLISASNIGNRSLQRIERSGFPAVLA